MMVERQYVGRDEADAKKVHNGDKVMELIRSAQAHHDLLNGAVVFGSIRERNRKLNKGCAAMPRAAFHSW